MGEAHEKSIHEFSHVQLMLHSSPMVELGEFLEIIYSGISKFSIDALGIASEALSIASRRIGVFNSSKIFATFVIHKEQDLY